MYLLLLQNFVLKLKLRYVPQTGISLCHCMKLFGMKIHVHVCHRMELSGKRIHACRCMENVWYENTCTPLHGTVWYENTCRCMIPHGIVWNENDQQG